MKKHKILFSFILLVFLSVRGQINTYSPYSYFGLGQLYSCTSVSSISMGGLGVSLSNEYGLNYLNPSANSFLDQTSFEFGFRSSFVQMSEDNLEQNNFVSGLLDLGLGFPIANNVGVSIGLTPYSSVGYNVTSQVLSHEDIGLIDYNYSGSGGLNKLLVGAGWECVGSDKISVSIGANLNYFFGDINKATIVSTENAQTKFREERSSIVNDLNFDIGLLIQYPINEYVISLGTKITPETSLKSSTNIFQYTYASSGDYESFIDTISYIEGNLDYITMPLDYSMGVSIGFSSKWLIGLDYNYTNWSAYDLPGGYMRDKNEIILGGKFIPKKDDIHNYFNRVEYKIGASYSSGYLDLVAATGLMNDPELTDDSILQNFSISMGMALPMNRVYSKANVGIRYGTRGYADADFIRESYFTIYASMTLNEKWFKKRKIE